MTQYLDTTGVVLPLYDGMCRAISECERVDEVKDIRDRAEALRAYYRQIKDQTAMRELTNIKLRAERRAGQLLKELARVEPQQRHVPGISPREGDKSPYAQALTDNDISTQTASRYQRMADIPEADFEAALSLPEAPSTRELADWNSKRKDILDTVGPFQVTHESLTVWSDLMELRKLLADLDAEPLHCMTDEMRQDIIALTPVVTTRLNAFIEVLNERS